MNSGFDFEGADRLLPEHQARVGHKASEPGDVVFTSKGTVGRFAFVSASPSRFVYSPQLCFWRITDPEVIDPRFLYFWMHGSECQSQFHALKGQTDMADYISLRDQRGIELSLPPLHEQRSVSATLGALDDKIASNKRLANVLRATMWAVFEHEIVNAEEPTADEADLTVVAQFVNGRAFTKDATGSGRPILRIKELNAGLGSATLYSDAVAKDENVARHHDLLFAWSGSLDAYRWHGPDSLINQHIFKVIPHEGYPMWFVEGWLRHHMSEFQRIAADKATTMGHIKRGHLSRARVLIPSLEKLGTLDASLRPLDQEVGVLAAESRTLEKMRDLLLPRLVMGRLRPPGDVEMSEHEGPLAGVAA